MPDEVRNELAARAARKGQSLQVYLREMLISTAARPVSDDWIARARENAVAGGSQATGASIVAMIREHRGE